MEISIIKATANDVADYKTIRKEAIRNIPEAFGLTKEEATTESNFPEKKWLRDLELRNQSIFLVRDDVKVIGLAKVGKDINNLWRINSVYINPDYRKTVIGYSIAEMLIKTLLYEITFRGGSQAYLWVLKELPNAIALYKSLGFEIVSYEAIRLLAQGDEDLIAKYHVMDLKKITI